MSLSDLGTPALLVERNAVQDNCRRMREKARASGTIFRPHVKTHKTIEGALLQHDGERGPICVSTLAEAEFFAAAGFDDITYAFPLAPHKIERAARLARSVRQLNLLLDNRQTLDAVERLYERSGQQLDFFLKVDCGYHRAGVDPESPESLELALHMARGGAVRLNGLLTHAGHSYHAKSVEEIKAIARQETGAVSSFAGLLRENRLEVTRSVGSTPTMSVVDRFTDCDEVRPGNYIFFDAYQAQLGSCDLRDAALSVLTTVVGIYPEERKVICDAGSLALSREGAPSNDSFGVICDEKLVPLPLRITSLSQEHGQIFADNAEALSGLRVGTRLRIIANHSCITAAMFDRYHVVSGAGIVEEWRPVRGW